VYEKLKELLRSGDSLVTAVETRTLLLRPSKGLIATSNALENGENLSNSSNQRFTWHDSSPANRCHSRH
jgi:hypothetical protein